MSAGYEVLMMATNMAHVAPIFLGLYQLILIDHDGDISKRDVAASALGVIAVLCAGTSIPLIAMIALFLVLQRQFKRAVLIAAPPAMLWLMWFIKYGTLNHGVKGDTQFTTFNKTAQIAQYMIKGMQGSLEAISHVSGSSTLLIILCFLGLYKKSIMSKAILMPFCMAVQASIPSPSFSSTPWFFGNLPVNRVAREGPQMGVLTMKFGKTAPLPPTMREISGSATQSEVRISSVTTTITLGRPAALLVRTRPGFTTGPAISSGRSSGASLSTGAASRRRLPIPLPSSDGRNPGIAIAPIRESSERRSSRVSIESLRARRDAENAARPDGRSSSAPRP
jgi:hypothetical protein